MSSTCLHCFSLADTQKLSESPVTRGSDISPPQAVRKFGQTAAKMTENIATKVMKEVGEKLQSVPKSIPVWVQSGVSRITKNDLDRSELQVKSSKTNGISNGDGKMNGISNGDGKTNGISNGDSKMNGISNGNGKTIDISLDESTENFKNSINNVETERNGNVCRSSEDEASVSSTENVPVIASNALVFNAVKSNGICEDVDMSDLGECSEKTDYPICKTRSVVQIHSAKVPSSSVKHSSSVSEFDMLYKPSHDDEIVFSRSKRLKKRHSTKGNMYSKL